MNRLPTTRRRMLTLPRRIYLLEEMLDATPRGPEYLLRRSIIHDRIVTYREALRRQEETNIAAYKLNLRKAFSAN